MPLDAQQITPLVRKWRERLGLHDWQISFEISPLPEEVAARTHANGDYRRAGITFNTDFEKGSMWGTLSLEQIVVHELLHVRLAGIDAAVRDFCDTVAGNGIIGKQGRERVDHECEVLCDSLSLSLLEQWPNETLRDQPPAPPADTQST